MFFRVELGGVTLAVIIAMYGEIGVETHFSELNIRHTYYLFNRANACGESGGP